MEKVTIQECSTISEIIKTNLQRRGKMAGYRFMGTLTHPQSEFTLTEKQDLVDACLDSLQELRTMKKNILKIDWSNPQHKIK